MTADVALRLGRVSNLPTVWTNVLGATVLAGAPMGAAVAAVALACSLFYVGGMFLNDAFDREFDARFRPERPIPAGLASAGAVFRAGFGLLAAGLVAVTATAWMVHGRATSGLVAGGALAAAIVLYDAWHKTNPAAPILMGLCRVLVYVTTAVTLAGQVAAAVLGWSLVLLTYLIVLTAVARHPMLGARPGLVATLVAGIALVDGLAIAVFGDAELAVVAVACFALTVVLQRWVPGT